MYAQSHPNRGSKWTQILIKNVLLEVNFQDEGLLYASHLFLF